MLRIYFAFEAARRLTGQEFSKKKTVEGGQTGECLEVSEFTTALSAGENQLRIWEAICTGRVLQVTQQVAERQRETQGAFNHHKRRWLPQPLSTTSLSWSLSTGEWWTNEEQVSPPTSGKPVGGVQGRACLSPCESREKAKSPDHNSLMESMFLKTAQ